MDEYGSDFESEDDSSGESEEDSTTAPQGGERQMESHSEGDAEHEERYTDSSQEQNSHSDGDSPAEWLPTAGSYSDVSPNDSGGGGDGDMGGAVPAATSGSRHSAITHHPALRPTRRRLQTHLLKARRAYNRRQGPRAVAEFVRALALARFVHGDRHWRSARCQVLLARAYLDLQDLPAQADEHASEALTTLLMYQGTDLVPDGKPQVLYVHLLARLVRGQALVLLRRPAAAEDCLYTAADLLATYSRLGRRPAETQRLQLQLDSWLGRAGAARGRLEPARERLEAALEQLSADRRQDWPARVRLMRELGQLELRGARRQNAIQAVEWLRQAAELSAQCWGEDSPEHLQAELVVLRAEHRLSDQDTAAMAASLTGLHGRCVNRLGSAHCTTVRVADQLVQVHTEQEYYEKAIRECRANTKAKVQVYGELSREVVDSLRTLGQLYVTWGHLDKAVEVGRRGLTIESLMYGKQDKRVQTAEQALSELERRLGSRAGGRFAGVRSRSSTSTAAVSLDDVLQM